MKNLPISDVAKQNCSTSDLIPLTKISEVGENVDIGTPYTCKEDHALHWTYGPCLRPTCRKTKICHSNEDADFKYEQLKHSFSLEVGTQEKLIDAAWIGFKKNMMINTLVTFRFCTLRDSDCPLVSPGGYEGVKTYIGQVRRWLTRPTRRIPIAYFWVRENVGVEGEHLHVGLHVPNAHLKAFVALIERSTGEPISRNSHNKSRGEIAAGEFGSWHVAVDDCKGTGPFIGYWVAAYCGKSEPSQRVFRGKLKNNTRKEERGKQFGGRLSRSKYDSPQGVIEGNHARKGRFTISRSLSSN